MSAAIEQRNQEATVYVGNLDEKVNEELLWELMLQCGPVVNVHMPKDKVTGNHMSYGFVEFRAEEDAEYAIKIMNMIKVYGKAIKVNKASQDKKQLEVGANIFIGNLDPDVDEKLLYDTFSAFGGILQTPKIMRDTDTGISKGYGFVSFDSFEASDLAIECMNGQYLSNRPIVVQYAFKKDSPGERHGSQAERILAASQPQRFKPHTMFSGGEVGDVTAVANGTGMGLQSAPQLSMGLMQMAGYNPMLGAVYGQQMPIQMQMPAPMMPAAPGALPAYMMAYGSQTMAPPPLPTQAFSVPPPPPPQLAYGTYTSAPPPPPPSFGAEYMPPPPAFAASIPPPPPPMMQ